jgi:trypsin
MTNDYDIALIKLSSPVQFTNTVSPICLPSTDLSFAGRKAMVTGWGTTSEGGSTSPQLLQADIAVMSLSRCTFSGGVVLTSRQICAGVQGPQPRDSCQVNFDSFECFIIILF